MIYIDQKMAISSAGLRPSLHFIYSLITLLHLLCRNRVLSDRNRFYHISSLCARERYHPLYKKIDGAVITSKSEDNLDCIITFQTDTILQRFMLRFEKLSLECNDHLYIFDGAHAFGNFKADLSCRSTRAEVGTIFTQSTFVTLKYVTDPYSKSPENGFRLIVTAIKDTVAHCKDHKCSNSFCISKDLTCDGINHCGDESDETSHASCIDVIEIGKILGLETNTFIAVVVSVFVVCFVCVVSLAICFCRKEQLIQHHQRISLQQQSSTHVLAHPTTYSSTAVSSLAQAPQRFATLPLERIRDKPPPYPGNFYPPAAGNAHSQVVFVAK